jgi:hypothetical protein
MEPLLSFLDELERTHIYHRFFADGSVEVEVFRATDVGFLSGDKAHAALERLVKEADEDVKA